MSNTDFALACPFCGNTNEVYGAGSGLGTYCDNCGADGPSYERDGKPVATWNDRAAFDQKTASVAWPATVGWYWAYGRIAGMREAGLMSARALFEGDQLIVYVGEAMTHRLSFPDAELPLQFKQAMLPKF